MEACDVLVFVYDSGDVNSFGYIANLRNRFNIDDVPCVIVATKSDCDLVQQVRKGWAKRTWSRYLFFLIHGFIPLQRFEVQPDAYCRDIGLAVPVSISIKDNINADLFSLLVGVAIDP